MSSDWTIAANYVPSGPRPGFVALGTLDARLGDIVRTTTQPLIGQMRLTWWHEQLCALDNEAQARGEPLLGALAGLRRHGVGGAELAVLVEGWERLLDEPLDDEALAAYAEQRGDALFALCGRLLDGQARGGAGWAIADLAAHATDPALRERALEMARERLPGGRIGGAKSLRVLVSLARSDLAAPRSRWSLLRAMVAA